MKELTNLTSEGIYHRIISSNKIRPDDYVCIVFGKPGPTGKSWITEQLNSMGYTAVEISEPLLIHGLVSFNDSDNHLIIDDFRKSIVIVLNKILPFYELQHGCFKRKGN